jgi:D-alanyl-D-alanine dipeptidase
MWKKLKHFLFLMAFISLDVIATQEPLPPGFVYLEDVDPTIKTHSRYSSEENFLGRKVIGYLNDEIIITEKAALALKEVQKEVSKQGLSLLVYDAYIPKRAINDFQNWIHDIDDKIMERWYFPNSNKAKLTDAIYSKIAHSRGSSVDVTLIFANKNVEVPVYSWRKLPSGKVIPYLDDGSCDMGTSFDLFNSASAIDNEDIPDSAKLFRSYLREAMEKYGFKNNSNAWWHYILKNEPFPNTYFDFVVE